MPNFSPTKYREFSIRFAGIRYNFFCTKTNSYRCAIHKARALCIGDTIITAQPSQFWKLNRHCMIWTFCGATRVGPIPANKVSWALADNRKLILAYEKRKIVQWHIFKVVASCYKCDATCELQKLYWHPYMGVGPQPGFIRKKQWIFWTPVCSSCVSRFDILWRKQLQEIEDRPEDDPWEFLSRPEINSLASQDRSGSIRWVRRFVAVGKFTPKEFRVLCTYYGNICLRCKKSLPLVADHVIPLAKGGANDIKNIQPLCAKCNGIKSDKLTDYRGRRYKTGSH